MYLQLLKSLIKKIAHFPKEPTHKGLTILDRLRKKKKEYTESHKIDELYEFLNDSSCD